MSKSVTRLFEQFKPEHYDLAITPDAETMKFTGSVTIAGKKVGRPSQRITFHQKDLKVTKASITKHDKKGDQTVEVSRINNQDSYNEVRLHTESSLYAGKYTVTMEFEAPITKGMTGLYPCFFDYEGSQHILLATQFESHHAREVFPCIDEPEAKATFDLTLTTPKGHTVLANTPAASTKESGKLVTTKFETTPKMSSYLLAFVTGELQSKSIKTKRGTDVSIWATVAQPANSLDFALDIAKGSIEFFEDYFNVPYPLPKSDHIALPDFSSGAMENWGLITYRERALLIYPEQSSQSIRELVSLVIAHETSHQWFGNLVTMKWWDDLWLNESFANMMEYQAVDSLHPEWHVWDAFIAQEGLSALRRDSTPGVQAVKTSVNHPDEISTLFDPSIVYAKGGRLLYMLKNYIGEDAFRKGLSAYFEKHQYGNTTGADLWAALSEASGIDVAAFMNPWLERSGFPVVNVEQSGSRLTLRQQHFSDNRDKADGDRLWPIPLFADQPQLPNSFDSRSCDLELTSNDIVVINSGAKGHYIVNYESSEQRSVLIDKIQAGQLSAAERLMLLNEASMLARAGYQHYSAVLELLEAFSSEDSEPVWDMISLILSELRRFIDHDPSLEDKIKALVRRLIAAQHVRLGWEESREDTPADQKLRATIIALGAYAEEPSIVAKSLELFEAYKANENAVPAELRSIVFSVPVKQGKAGALDYLLELHDKTNNSDLKSDISAAATSTRNSDEASKLLERLKDAKKVKPQDADRWLVYLMRNRYVMQTAWQWMVANWKWIEETYSHDKSYDMLPRYAATACNTTAWADKYREFFEPKQDQVPLKRNIVIGLEEVSNRVAWLTRDLKSVQKYFEA